MFYARYALHTYDPHAICSTRAIYYAHYALRAINSTRAMLYTCYVLRALCSTRTMLYTRYALDALTKLFGDKIATTRIAFCSKRAIWAGLKFVHGMYEAQP